MTRWLRWTLWCILSLVILCTATGCGSDDSNDSTHQVCSDSSQCASGTCIQVPCPNGTKPTVCGGVICLTSDDCSGGLCIVLMSGGQQCVPASACGG